MGVYWVEVSGYPMPQRYAGHSALELCNTWAGWREEAWTSGSEPLNIRREWLRDYDRFAVWAGYVDLLDAAAVARRRREAGRAPEQAERVLNRARELRSALYSVLTGTGDAAAFALVAATARWAAAASELVDEQRDGQRIARWRLPDSVGLEQPLLAVAGATAELLASPDRSKVRSCPGEDCGWLFIDRRGRRRWCSMDSCGNRAKVRAHAERRRATQ